MRPFVTFALTYALGLASGMTIGGAVAQHASPAATVEQVPPYDRNDWRHWTTAKGECLSTRDLVLIRDAVQFELSDDGCKVLRGAWKDPYTGTVVSGDAKKVHVDHVVALKWAHLHGAWAWDAARREAYANDMTYRHHLVASSARSNTRKSAKGPAEFRPDDRKAWCRWAETFSAIAVANGLAVGEADRAAVRDMLGTC